MEKKEIAIIAVIIVAVFAVLYPYIPYFHQSSSVTATSSGSGGSSVTATASPYVDYITTSGEVIREYLDTGQIYIVEPDGQLVPYTSYTFVAPGTTQAVSSVQYGFGLSLKAQYLEGTSSAQNVTVKVLAVLTGNSSSDGSVDIFNNQQFTYSLSGAPTTVATGSETITSSTYNMTQLAQDIWGSGFSTSTTALYYPQYEVTITASGTTVFGQPISATASQTYPYTVIGKWQWAAPQLSVSLGSASTTYSLFGGLSESQVLTGAIVILIIAAFAYMMIRREER